MRIEQGWKLKKLKDLEAGDIFYLCGCIYIKTDHQPVNEEMISCFELVTGELHAIAKIEYVGVVKDAVLKLGGYYNHG